MKPRYWLVLLYAAHVGCAQAEIYKYIDAEGHVTYSSTPMKGAKRLDLEPLPTIQPPPVRSRSEASPSTFPRVDSTTQRSRDDTRRKILTDELSTEERLLAEARKSLKEGEETPEVYKGKDGRTYRNVGKFDEKMKTLQDDVTLHEKNIESLKSEISNLK